MNWTSILTIASWVLTLGIKVVQAFDTTTTGSSLQAVANVVQSDPNVQQLEAAGAAQFPLLTPALHAAAAALALLHTNNTTFFQNAINDLIKAGTVKGINLLEADGKYGPLTTAAVKAFQAMEGLPQTGAPDDATYNALYTLISKM